MRDNIRIQSKSILIATMVLAVGVVVSKSTLALADCNGSQWIQNPTGMNYWNNTQINYNPCQFATDATANALAAKTGGTVVDVTYAKPSPFQLSQPIADIIINKVEINAGLLANSIAIFGEAQAMRMLAVDTHPQPITPNHAVIMPAWNSGASNETTWSAVQMPTTPVFGNSTYNSMAGSSGMNFGTWNN